ncbi:MAG: sigma-70 family RNA polymerase sigma factor [Rhizobacter sp.]|nr:sigma-70 family RNA polymerase sigma factor [Ferruginibacter sp.]
MTEEDIIKGSVKGDNSCQRILFDKYAGRMMSLCLRYTKDAHTAQDILQLGFIRVFDSIHQFKGEGNFEGWMRRVFVSVALRQLSKKKLNFREMDGITIEEHYEAPSAVAKISENELHALIRKLPDGYQTVFNLIVIEGYSHEEVGELLKITSSTSRTQLLKARKMLQGLISKCFSMVMI